MFNESKASKERKDGCFLSKKEKRKDGCFSLTKRERKEQERETNQNIYECLTKARLARKARKGWLYFSPKERKEGIKIYLERKYK